VVLAGTDGVSAGQCFLQVRMLKAMAQPADFVAFKLDIDNYTAGGARASRSL